MNVEIGKDATDPGHEEKEEAKVGRYRESRNEDGYEVGQNCPTDGEENCGYENMVPTVHKGPPSFSRFRPSL